MTAKHVTVEGLAAALREQSDGEAAAAENMDYLFSGSLDDLAGRVLAALPDDCPAEAHNPTLCSWVNKCGCGCKECRAAHDRRVKGGE